MPVRVEDREGRFVAWGLVEEGPIGVRVWTTRDEGIDERLVASRIARAAELRTRIVPPETSAYRLVHGEGDALPGVVVDVYGDYAVIQFDGAAAVNWSDAVVDGVSRALPGLRGVLVRIGRREGKRTEVARGEAPPVPLEVREHGMLMRADLLHGQKTGLFIDHRESRRAVRTMASGLRVLNLYGYTGGFSIAAGLGGATQVDTVDVAGAALALADEGWAANGLPARAHQTHARDVPEFLEAAREAGTRWDLIVSDPPSFAPNEASLTRALKSYRALHRACLRLLAPGGYYLAASCSSHVDHATFDRTVREGAEKARRPLQALARWGAPADHPRLVAFPEGEYLKCVLTRALT